MNISVVNDIPEEKWRTYISEHPCGNIFHTPEMFHVFNNTVAHQPQVWAAVHQDSILALMLPVQITLFNGILRRLSTRTIVYGGVLYTDNEKGKKALVRLLQTYKCKSSKKPLYTEIRNRINSKEMQSSYCKNDFYYEDELNYLINLRRTPETIMQGFGRRTRQNIRRGLKQAKIVIEEASNRDQVIECYKLITKSYQSAKVPLADCSLFNSAFDILHPKGMVRFLIARMDQIPVAASVELIHKDIIFGWFSGIDRTFSSYIPNELLMWHILEWGAKNGYRLYDFGGAGKPNEKYGVRNFKAKFKGDLVCYGRNIYVHSHLFLNLSKLGYGIYRRFL